MAAFLAKVLNKKLAYGTIMIEKFESGESWNCFKGEWRKSWKLLIEKQSGVI